MSVQTFPAGFLYCLGRSARAGLMREMGLPGPAGAANQFRKGMPVHPLPQPERSLAAHEMMNVPAEDFTVVCLAGGLWLTRYGDSEDYFVGPGESFSIRRGERAVVQALKPSRVRLVAT